MPSFTLTLTSEQAGVLQAWAAKAGYTDPQTYLQDQALNIFTQRVDAENTKLVDRARWGASLTDKDKARLRAILGL